MGDSSLALDTCTLCGEDRWEVVREGCDLYRSTHPKIFRLSRCLSCGHVMQNPVPGAEELREAYSVQYAPYRPAWREKAWPLWKILRELTTWRRLRRLRRFGRGSRLLEVGAGAGDFLCAAQRIGWDVRATEYSETLADALRTECGFDVRTEDLTPGLWEPGDFDLVAFWSVIEHLQNPADILRIASAYLKPQGIVFIQIPTRSGIQAGKSFGKYWALLDLPRHINFFDKNTLSILCNRAGLELTVFETPLLDTAWCYWASGCNYINDAAGRGERALRFAGAAIILLLAMPYAMVQAWRGHGSEAFAVAVKRH